MKARTCKHTRTQTHRRKGKQEKTRELTGNSVGLFYKPVDTSSDKIIGPVRFGQSRIRCEWCSWKWGIVMHLKQIRVSYKKFDTMLLYDAWTDSNEKIFFCHILMLRLYFYIMKISKQISWNLYKLFIG